MWQRSDIQNPGSLSTGISIFTNREVFLLISLYDPPAGYPYVSGIIVGVSSQNFNLLLPALAGEWEGHRQDGRQRRAGALQELKSPLGRIQLHYSIASKTGCLSQRKRVCCSKSAWQHSSSWQRSQKGSSNFVEICEDVAALRANTAALVFLAI